MSILHVLLHVCYTNPPIQYALACAPRLLQGLRSICLLVVPPWGLRGDSGSVARELQLCSLLLPSQLVLSDAGVCQCVCLLPGLLDFCVEGMESKHRRLALSWRNTCICLKCCSSCCGRGKATGCSAPPRQHPLPPRAGAAERKDPEETVSSVDYRPPSPCRVACFGCLARGRSAR